MNPAVSSRSGRPPARIVPAQPLRAAKAIVGFVALLYLVTFVDTSAFDGALAGNHGIHAQHLAGLDGVLWSPLLHGGYAHLAANTVPVLVFGWLAMAGGMAQFLAVTATVWLVGGLGTWMFAPETTMHVGASGIAFGWFVFLLARGLFTRGLAQIAVAAVLFFLWGSLLWGMLPGQPGISWQGHLFGALAGVFAAWIVGRAHRAAASA